MIVGVYRRVLFFLGIIRDFGFVESIIELVLLIVLVILYLVSVCVLWWKLLGCYDDVDIKVLNWLRV